MLKTLLKVRFASLRASMFRSSRRAKSGNSTVRTIGFGILFLYVIACFFIMFGGMFLSLCVPLHELGLGWLYFAIAGLMAFMLSFIGNVFATQTQLFEAKDNELLLSMPIAPKFILGSRMLLLLVLNLAYILIVMIPAGVVYCMNFPVTVGGVLYFVISCLLLPMMVQAFSCLIAWVISIISSRMRNKNVITMVFSLGFLAAYFYLYSKMGDIITKLITNGASIAAAFQKYVFPAYYFGVGIAEHNLTYLLLYTVCTLVVFELIYAILSRSFRRITTAQRGAARIKYKEKAMRVSSPSAALLRKDFRHFIGNPMYVMNAWLGEILLVVCCVALLVKRELLQQLLPVLSGGEGTVGLILCVVLCGISCTNLIAAPSISLEGKSLWIAQSIPVPAAAVLRAKARLQMLMCIPLTALASLLVSVILRLSLPMAAMVILLPAAFNAFSALLGVIVNLHFPKFDYINETAVIKQSMSVVICMFGSMGVVLLLSLLYALLLGSVIAPVVYLAVCLVLLIIVCALMWRYLAHGGSTRFARLQSD